MTKYIHTHHPYILNFHIIQSGNRATSAGRRKNNEWKSKVLPKKNPKEPQLKNIKSSKASQLRSSTIAKKYDRKKKEEKPKPAPIPEDTVTDDVEVKKHQEQTTTHAPTHVQENETKYNHRQDNSKSEPIGKPMERRSTYTFGDNGSSGIISNELLHQIQKELKNDETISEPNHVPGILTVVLNIRHSNAKPLCAIGLL